MSQLAIVLWASVALQVFAVILALRLIPITRRALAWMVLSGAFLLMAMRRAISLLHQENLIESSWLQALTAEVVALVISIMMLVGVSQIKTIFVQRREAEDQLRKLSLAVEQSSLGTFITDRSGVIEYVNPRFCELKQQSKEELIGQTIEIISDEVSNVFYQEMWDVVWQGKDWRIDVYDCDKQNQRRWYSVIVVPVNNEKREISNFLVTLEDITKAKEQHRELERSALYDSLTGLPNRALFNDRLSYQLNIAARNKSTFSVLMMDLDRFKEINDTLGHHIGDKLLQEIGPRIANVLRESDTVARMGGDEFLFLLPDVTIDTSAVMASKILGTLDRPFEIEGHTLQVGGSVGIVMFPEHGEHIDTLIQRADIAMYGAKKQKIGFVVYDPETDQHSMRSLALVGELRHAIENEELILHYHPKIDLKTNECVGVEALVRWEHKERGLLMPDLFIPIAERTGLIATLSQWVLENAMDQIATLNQNGFELDVSINLSAQDIQDPLLPEQIQKLIRKTGIDSSNVVLEITESTLMTDVQKAMEILSLLKKMGLKLAIDDFGTGYSSLEYLKKLSVHELKIDKSFVCEMSTDENDAVIVRSIIDLAHNLGLNVVAEGVENRDSLDLLEMLSCDTVQGFYFTKPLDLESLLKFLSARKWDKGKRTVSRAS